MALVLAAVLWAGGHATLQTEDKAKGSNSKDSISDTTPQIYFGKGTKHKLLIGEEDSSLYNELLSRSAVTDEIDYGSFKMIVVDEQAIGGRSALMDFRDQVRDEQNLIALNGYILDTTGGELTLNKVPGDLRQTDMTDAIANKGVPPRGGLYIVQFAGPVKDEWLELLKGTGAELVTYIPNNAYVVRADATEALALSQFRGEGFVQFVGDYEPAFRLSTALQAVRAEGQNALDNFVDVTVQVIGGENARATVERLKGMGVEFISEHEVLNYHNVALKIGAARLGEIASIENVFAVEERGEPRLLDEAQGQILAGQFSTFDNDEFPTPVGPFYLNFLASKGFNSSQFGGFGVNVVDDAYTLTGASGHPDLPFNRVGFQNNPANKTDAQGGHGFLNAHIIAGFNNSTGAAFEDADGHNYGLGVAPWARVGLTTIFGPNSKNIHPTDWESTAYDQGARISSNSWGKVTILGNPVPRYDTNAQEYDRIVRDARGGDTGNQQLLVVFAAGNDGKTGNNTVSTPATAKNVITVGASENFRPTPPDGCNVGVTGANSASDMADFSSLGPVNSAGGDGRIKPDIVAPGTHILAGVPQSNYSGTTICDKYMPPGQTLYGWSSGTSHSCPAVAGGAALVDQYFINKGFGFPSPAMAKAYLMNSATYITGAGAGGSLPSNSQGMGRMDLKRAFDDAHRILVDQKSVLSATGSSRKVTGSISDSSRPFRVTLAWTDAPGPTTGAPYVNNLDLEVTVNGTTYKGNVFSGANSTVGGSADTRNNVESVFLPAGISGNFTITIRAANIAGDGVPGDSDLTDQDFALVVYNGEQRIAVNSQSMSFTATVGGTNPASQTLNVTDAGGGIIDWHATDNATWLSISPTGGASSATTVSVNINGLTVGTYSGTITITAFGATNSPAHVPVTLTVNPPPPAIHVNPASLNFTVQELAGSPTNKPLSITNSGGGTLNWTASDDATWLSLTSQSGTAPSTVVALANVSGLAAGTYNGTITITASGATNSPLHVPVTLTVTPAPEMSINPTGMSFAATAGGANPATQTLSVTNSGGGTLIWGAGSDATWLSVSPQSGATPSGTTSTATVSVNISGLAVGTYNGTITLQSPGANEIRYLPVTLIVSLRSTTP